MHGSSLTSGLLRPLIGGVNAMERFNAARNPFREGSQYGWVWVVLAVVALGSRPQQGCRYI